MTRQDFTYQTRCKGQIFNNTKITNNSNYCIFYKGDFVGEVKTKKDAEDCIANFIKYNKLTYTQTYC